MSNLERLVTELERSHAEAQERLADPAVYNDRREAEEAGRRLKRLEGPYRLAEAWRQAIADLAAARAPRPGARRDIPEYLGEADRLATELELSLVEADPADEKDVIVEIRQGVGGDEAAPGRPTSRGCRRPRRASAASAKRCSR